MANILINLLLVGLLLLSCLMTIIILMQRPSANAGMGASLGGGAAESVFGGETANVLLKNTIWVAVGFFVLCFLLFLWIVARVDHTPKTIKQLPANPAAAEAAAEAAATTGNATAAMPVVNATTTPVATTGAANVTTPAIVDLNASATPAAGNATTPAAPAPATP